MAIETKKLDLVGQRVVIVTLDDEEQGDPNFDHLECYGTITAEVDQNLYEVRFDPKAVSVSTQWVKRYLLVTD